MKISTPRKEAPILAASFENRHWCLISRFYSILKLCSKYEKMGYFWSPLIVMLNTVKIMLAVLVRCFYDIFKYMASLGTAKRSNRINDIGALLCPSLAALVVAWIAFSCSSEALRLTFFLPRGIALQL